MVNIFPSADLPWESSFPVISTWWSFLLEFTFVVGSLCRELYW